MPYCRGFPDFFGQISTIPTRLIPSRYVGKFGICVIDIICIFTFYIAFLVYQKIQYQYRINKVLTKL